MDFEVNELIILPHANKSQGNSLVVLADSFFYSDTTDERHGWISETSRSLSATIILGHRT
jgi:hypothetical protein